MAVTRVECLAGEGNEWRQWQWIGTSIDRTEGISIVGGEVVTTDDERDRGDGVGKAELLGSGVCLGSQSSACSVRKKRWEVHPGVAMFEGRVAGDEGQEDKMVVDVKDGELMMYDKCFCEW